MTRRKRQKLPKELLIQYIILGCIYFGIMFFVTLEFGPQRYIVLRILIILITGVGGFYLDYYSIFVFKDPFFPEPLYKQYSLSENGIRIEIQGEMIEYSWDEVVDAGIAISDGLRRKLPVYGCWIYFSKEPVPQEKKRLLSNFWAVKKPVMPGLPVYVNDYIMINYDPLDFPQLLEVVPEWMREKLIAEEKQYVVEGKVITKYWRSE